MTNSASPTAARALLVHGSDATWRHSLRAALRAVPDVGNVTVLVSSREAEAAKCLADPRVVLAVVIDEPAIRRTLSTLAPSLPVVWVAEGDNTAAVAERVRLQLDALLVTRRATE